MRSPRCSQSIVPRFNLICFGQSWIVIYIPCFYFGDCPMFQKNWWWAI
jgi:hypothetical protein